MKLYLLRHGEAANIACSDSQRPLTEAGIRDTRQVVERMADQLSDVGAIYTSPKLRARQTAEIAFEIIGGDRQPIETDLIKPSGDIDALGRFLEQQPGERILLATHQPFVGSLLDYLIDEPGRGSSMGTSCLACLELIAFSRGCATLKWLEHP